MPAKNRLKVYVADGYYHVYNRGVNKYKIFKDSNDYLYFTGLIDRYLAPYNPEEAKGAYPNFANDISIVAYCLMPNHFHILIHQSTEHGMTKFMRALATSYTMYFNKKYKRVGTLFQGAFKAIYIEDNDYLLHLSRYIHCNPINWGMYPYSSYQYYRTNEYPNWIDYEIVKSQFDNSKGDSYEQFINNYKKYPKIEIENIY